MIQLSQSSPGNFGGSYFGQNKKVFLNYPKVCPLAKNDIGSVDHFADFWIQKSHHFNDFWIQKYLHFYDFWIQKYNLFIF